MSAQSFQFSGRIRSVRHALDGCWEMLQTQHNAWIHLVATILVIVLALALSIRELEWVIVVVAIVMVWTAEALNTAFELLCDVASPEFHPVVKRAKDVAAGAVLISALGAITIGVLVFLPYLT